MLYKLSLKTPMKIGKCTKPNCIVPTDSWPFMTHRTWQLFRPKGLERTPSNYIQWIAVAELLLSYPFQTYQTTLYYIHSWMFPSRWKSGYLSWLQLRFGSEGPEQAHFNLACPWLDSVRSWDCYAQRTRKWQDLKHKELATDTLRSPQAIGITKFQNLLMLYLSKPLSLLQALWHSTTTLNKNLLRLLRKQKVRHHPWLSPVSQGSIQENLKQLHWQENIRDHSSYTCSRFLCPACRSLQEIDLHAGPAGLLWQLSSEQIKYSQMHRLPCSHVSCMYRSRNPMTSGDFFLWWFPYMICHLGSFILTASTVLLTWTQSGVLLESLLKHTISDSLSKTHHIRNVPT